MWFSSEIEPRIPLMNHLDEACDRPYHVEHAGSRVISCPEWIQIRSEDFVNRHTEADIRFYTRQDRKIYLKVIDKLNINSLIQ